MIELINPAEVSKPFGYSHVCVVSAGRQMHVSGQVALDSAGALVGAGDIAAQAAQVYANLAVCLAGAGATFADVFKIVTYVVGLTPETAAAIRAVRVAYLGAGPYPASTMVGVPALVDPRFLIEVEVIAALPA
jgi:enamine deaminase RidA (YjgF/YER057c/UK114 family)